MSPGSCGSALRDWGRLLRLSLFPTAPADVAAGVVVAAGGWPAGPAPALLLLGSASVYHGALVLNDWADREADRRLRPDRPLPCGRIAPRRALVVALALLAAGPLLARAASPTSAGILAAVAALAVLYNVRLRGPWIGPTLLAACRAGNLTLGLCVTDALPRAPWIALAPAYGAYVFAVSRLGRLEDRADRLEERRLHPRWLLRAAAVLLLAPALLASGSGARDLDQPAVLSSLVLSVAAALGLVRAAADSDWSLSAVQRRMDLALRRLLIFSASVALLSSTREGGLVAAAILCGYPLSHALRRAFPPS
jgi:4-hydroxybenzoate polyprenyltransferase